MNRRWFLKAMAAAAAAPLAAGSGVLDGMSPRKRHGLSSDEIDELVQITLEDLRMKERQQLADLLEEYFWIKKDPDHIYAIDWWLK